MAVVTGSIGVRVANGPKAATTNGTTPTHVTQRQTFSITLDASFEWGNLSDKAAFVVIGDATPNIVSRTPAATTLNSKAANGAMLNHLVGTNQAYDERAAEDFATGYGTPDEPPFSVKSGDIYTICLSTTDNILNQDDARVGVPEDYGTFFFVSEAPLEGAMSPAGLTWQGRNWLEYHYIDFDTKISAIQDYDTSGFSNLPDFTTLYDRMRVFCPILAGDNDTFNPIHYRATTPRSLVAGQNTGKALCETINDACLVLISSSYTDEQKKQMAIALCSFGIQCGEPYVKNNLPIEANGQHYQFHFTPWALAAHWAGRTAEIETHFSYSGNFKQAFQFTQELIDRLAPHDSLLDPWTSRRRNLNAKGVGTMTFQMTVGSDQGDNPKGAMNGLIVTDGVNETQIISSPQDISTGSQTYGVVDSSDFTVDTDVWTIPPAGAEPSVGEYDWTIQGIPFFQFYSRSRDAAYREENYWSGQVLLLKALGINPNGVLDNVFGYVQRANLPNTPSADLDFSDHHTTAFEEEFWNAHAATIFA